jgi:hypothetical protein
MHSEVACLTTTDHVMPHYTLQVINTVQHILNKGLDGVNFDYEASALTRGDCLSSQA